MKKTLITILKFAISFSILGYLFYQTGRDQETLHLFWNEPKKWKLLSLAWMVVMLATTLTFVRWYLLVRALELPFSLRDALRLGFVGYLFNFLTLGVAGGDLIKLVFLAREQKDRRTEAATSIVLDRIMGLYAMFLVASVAAFLVDLDPRVVRDPTELAAVTYVGKVAVVLAATGTFCMIVILLPGFATNSVWESFGRAPFVGSIILRLINAVRTYRKKPYVLLLALLLSLSVHLMLSLGIYLVARGLSDRVPSVLTHFFIVPIANVANGVPLPGGLGAFEFALNAVYHAVSPAEAAARQGFVVALGFRLVTLTVAGVGMFYWIAGRKKVADLLREAELEHAE